MAGSGPKASGANSGVPRTAQGVALEVRGQLPGYVPERAVRGDS